MPSLTAFVLDVGVLSVLSSSQLTRLIQSWEFPYILRRFRAAKTQLSEHFLLTHPLHGNPFDAASHLTLRAWQGAQALVGFAGGPASFSCQDVLCSVVGVEFIAAGFLDERVPRTGAYGGES